MLIVARRRRRRRFSTDRRRIGVVVVIVVRFDENVVRETTLSADQTDFGVTSVDPSWKKKSKFKNFPV